MHTSFCLYFQGHVVMGNNAISPYQQVIEKTKSLSFRSQMLAMNIEKKQAHSTRNEVRNAHSTVNPERNASSPRRGRPSLPLPMGSLRRST